MRQDVKVNVRKDGEFTVEKRKKLALTSQELSKMLSTDLSNFGITLTKAST